jgi:hypothetical protein
VDFDDRRTLFELLLDQAGEASILSGRSTWIVCKVESKVRTILFYIALW